MDSLEYEIQEYIEELEKRVATATLQEKILLTTIIRELKELVDKANANSEWDDWVNNG